MDDEVMTLDVLCKAIRHYIEQEIKEEHEGNELSLYGITTDDALGKVLEMKGGQIKIVVNVLPRQLHDAMVEDAREEQNRQVFGGQECKWPEGSGPYPNSKVMGG